MLSAHRSPLPPLAVKIDPDSRAPLYRQLYDHLRGAILSRQLAAGSLLPSTRTMAAELGVSRMTVVVAYEQLLAEGYIEGRLGSGTYVSHSLPDDHLVARSTPHVTPEHASRQRRLSQRGQRMASAAQSRVMGRREPDTPRAFRNSVPALDQFPYELWHRLVVKCSRDLPRGQLAYGTPAGYRPLQEAIAAYLMASRAVKCSPDQVIIVAGSQPALDMTAQLLLDPGDVVWHEDPGYRGVRGAFTSASAQITPVPVNGEGIDLEAGIKAAPHARMVYVTPSHQYPLGMTMSLRRRLALLEWAERADAWILEDDYDSEYRFVGRPLPALQGLDTCGRVLYVGTFSKVLFPALRLGYLVVPPDLVESFTAARVITDDHPPVLEQVVMTRFITEGHFARHIRRMRTLYAERQACLLDEGRRLEGLLTLERTDGGMHLLGWLPEGVSDVEATQRAWNTGVETMPLSILRHGTGHSNGLMLGFAAVNEAAIAEGVTRLHGALSTLIR
ncbi:MAG: PLP-dependent aminotransferase family protein [Anaerolineae bacterium]|nr:PLP-dependent aminotransferase family protein [Anaerolineae bacterium]